MCSMTLTWKVTLMKSFSSKLVGIALLVVIAFIAFSYYGSGNLDAKDSTVRQSRARWAWIAASRDLLPSVPDDEKLGDECADCNGDGFVGDGSIKIECNTCNGTGKRGFQMTILEMPVQDAQARSSGSCSASRNPVRGIAKHGKNLVRNAIGRLRCRK